ncbi:MAG TPA: GNAT family protein [Actinomycetota bacterium]|nr:GNAT family protein [Actinomycetota bacterium]
MTARPAAPELTDGHIRLRGPREDDIPAITAASQDPDIARWTMVPSGYTEDDALAFVRGTHRPGGDEISLVILDAATEELLGTIGLRIDGPAGVGDIGYWVKREARGRGVATRAVRLVATWAFAARGLGRIELMAATENAASRRVAERAGFTLEGILRARLPGPDGRLDAALYSLLPSDLGGGAQG